MGFRKKGLRAEAVGFTGAAEWDHSRPGPGGPSLGMFPGCCDTVQP